ncbi:MAG: M14 family zinc carboxypeptidase [Planctomycetota bacterium]|nr:M14 family zinc carboxypeptidase [Planctomycetota bacterium]
MNPTFIIAAALGVAIHAPAQVSRQLYSIQSPSPTQWLWIQQHFDALDSCCGVAPTDGPVSFVATAAQKGLVASLLPNAEHQRPVRSFQQTYAEALAAAGIDNPPPTAYYTVAEIEAAIDAEVAAAPSIAAKVDLSALPGGALTHDGNSIYALKVSDNVAADEDEPAIFVIAQHHARELNSPHMVIGAMSRLVSGYATDPALQAVVDEYEVYFVPMVNPDGVDHVWNVDEFWRKNRRLNSNGSYGVDLNRNYPFLWGQCGASTNESSNTYRGPSPASEPETVTMRNAIARLRPEIYIDFHSSGQEVLRTYAPCANEPSAVAAFIERYVDDLRAPMTYGKRYPSASGEAPEDHWASGGTLSYLIEIGTSFQPDFALTVTEEARVWPGVERALTAWRPAVRGHVTSSAGNQPLEATITFSPSFFSLNEQTMSRVRDGRYGLWLPLGTWTVTYSAPGHLPATTQVTVTNYDQPVTNDVTLIKDAYALYGEGCPGSVPQPPQPCPALNATGGTLSNTSRDNEYCYTVTQSDTLTITGFEIFTSSTGGTVSIPAHIYLDNNGGPEASPTATTSVQVGATPGFYTATFAAPVTVTGTFYLGLDTSSQNAFISNLTNGNSGGGYYRDLVNGPNNWTASGLVQRPAWSVFCQQQPQGLTPALSFDGLPQLGATYEPTLADAVANSVALLASGLDNQAYQGVALPFELPNAPGCDLLVSADVLDLAPTDANGEARQPIPVPNTPSLVGTVLYHQWLVWDPTVNGLNVVTTNAGEATVQN